MVRISFLFFLHFILTLDVNALNICREGIFSTKENTSTIFFEPQSQSFDVEESIYYELQAGTSIEDYSELDMLKFRGRSSIQRHTYQLVNDMYSEEIEFKSQNNLVPHFMPETEKIVYRNNGIQIFKSASKDKAEHTKYFPYSKEEIQDFEDRKKSFSSQLLLTKFMTGTEMLDELKQDSNVIIVDKGSYTEVSLNGLVYSFYPLGYYSMFNPTESSTTYYHPDEMIMVTKYPESSSSFHIQINFEINSQGYLTPQVELLSSNVNLYDGKCVKRITRKEYSNYKYQGFRVESRSQLADENDSFSDSVKFKCFPNPSVDEIVIEGKNLENSTVEIRSINGDVHDIPLNRIDNTRLELNTRNLSKGIYLVSVYSKNEVTNFKIVKN